MQLFAEVRRLRTEVERLKQPPTTSQNSSQPPSRDQKRNLPGGRRHRRRGAKPGHAKALATVIDTAELRAQPVFDTPVHLLGAPVLPYLSAQKAQAVTNFSFNVK